MQDRQAMHENILTRGRHLDHVAWLYDPLIEKMSFGREQKFRIKTLQHMDIAPSDKVLDVGCGTGSLTLQVAERLRDSGQVIGIDAAPKMIAIARRKAQTCGSKADFSVGVSEQLEFADGAFDFVVNSMFTHHIDRELKQRSFKEMYRVLRPGGKLLTVDIDRPTTILGMVMGWGGRFALFQKELVDNLRGDLPSLIEEAGFLQVRNLENLYGIVSFFSACKPLIGK